MQQIGRRVLTVLKGLPRYWRPALQGAPYTHFDLLDVDHRYEKMHRLHASAHTGLIAEAKDKGFNSVLEVACGAGWNIPYFKQTDLEYFGLDISETAVAIAALKFPENRFFNIDIRDCSIIADGSFDLVYNSSMLEHIGYFREAIAEMLRLARRELWILFFEGLSDAKESSIKFHPYTPDQISGHDKDIYGRKVVLQDHVHEARKGWYWNRYAQREILSIFEGTPHSVEILNRTNRPFLDAESVLVVRKRLVARC